MTDRLRETLNRVRSFFRKQRLDHELDAEMATHLEFAIEENLRRGLSPEEARRQALVRFGGVQQAKERHREARGLPRFEVLLQDLRYGFRMLRKTPGFTAICVVTLALGIGANTAIFSLINAVMLRSLPIQDPRNVVVLQWSARKTPTFHAYRNYGDTKSGGLRGPNPNGTSFSHPFLQGVEESAVFSGVAAFAGSGQVALSGNGPATNVRGQMVSGGFFTTLGIRAFAGRTLQPSDDNPSVPPALVLNYSYWQKAFGSSDSAIGKVVKINGVPFTIVGVADPKFAALSFGNVYDLFIPMNFAPVIDPNQLRRFNDAQGWWVLIAARLKPGIPASQAQAAIEVLFRNDVLHGDKPMSKEADAPTVSLIPASTALIGHSGDFADPLRVMMVAVGIVLLIACANVAGLVLARTTSRKREIDLRLALGARRGRLLRQLLTESMILAIAGGALGALMAWWGAQAIVAMISSSENRPIGLTADLDLRVLAFTAAVSILTGILFGAAPALRSLRLDITTTLKEGSPASSGTQQGRHRWFSMGNALVVFQAALAMVVLMGAGLLVHSLTNLKRLNPGFDTRNVLTFGLNPTVAEYKPLQVDDLYRTLHEQILAMPGVLSVSYSESALLSGSWSRTAFSYVPPHGPKRVEQEADWMPISADFFDTMKIPLLAGRVFMDVDFETAAANAAAERARREAKPGSPPPPTPTVPACAIVNQMFAKKYFPGMNPLGQHFGAEDGSDPERPKNPGYQIVGVVEDAKYNSLRREIDPTMYVPLTSQSAVFEVRTAGDPNNVVALIRNLINRQDSNLPMSDVKTQSEQIDMLLARERIIVQLSSFFGIVALLLACVGLYGLLSYEVSHRTREIGIRMALGARRSHLIRMVVSQGAALALTGTATGVAAAIGVGRLLATMLYGVKPSDPATLMLVALLLMLVALAAAFIPARRASTVDPMIALRYE